MHSSGMRTARLLTVSQYALCRGRVSQHALGTGCLPRGCLPRGVCLGGVCPGGCLPREGVCLPRGCLPGGGVSAQRGCLPEGGGRHPLDQRQSPPEKITDRCKTLHCRNFVTKIAAFKSSSFDGIWVMLHSNTRLMYKSFPDLKGWDGFYHICKTGSRSQ